MVAARCAVFQAANGLVRMARSRRRRAGRQSMESLSRLDRSAGLQYLASYARRRIRWPNFQVCKVGTTDENLWALAASSTVGRRPRRSRVRGPNRPIPAAARVGDGLGLWHPAASVRFDRRLHCGPLDRSSSRGHTGGSREHTHARSPARTSYPNVRRSILNSSVLRCQSGSPHHLAARRPSSWSCPGPAWSFSPHSGRSTIYARRRRLWH